MSTVTERACAKLNLTLDVTGRRSDGYHEVRMVMESVDLWDDVTVSLRADGRITSRSNLRWLPRDGRNAAVKAAAAFFQATGLSGPGADIVLEKRIPVGAGMAGGSSDAAAVLRALNRLTGAGLDAEGLRQIAIAAGCDTVYCVQGGSMLAEGRGEVLSPLPMPPDCGVVVCKPAFSISTAELYGRVDSRAARTRPDTAGLIGALGRGDLRDVAQRMYNVFEDVLPRRCGEVAALKGLLLERGALGAVMTGTGSAVFGLFEDTGRAVALREELLRKKIDCYCVKFVSAQEV